MNKKGISMLVIVAIVVIAVVVGGIAAYYVLTSGEGEPTPTPTPTGPDVAGATSISFDVGIPDVETDKFTAKNLGTNEILLRVDQTDAQGVYFIYLMNQAEQTAWADFGGTGFTDQSEYFEDTYWNSDLIGKVALDKYIAALDAGWSGSGSFNGDGYVIDNIALNPELADSIFEPD